MKRFKKLVLTMAALGALAVAGAAFAQAQSAGTAAKTQVETRSVETGGSGNPADAPNAADQNEADGNEAGEQGSDAEAKADKPDMDGEQDSPDGPNDQQGPNEQSGQSE